MSCIPVPILPIPSAPPFLVSINIAPPVPVIPTIEICCNIKTPSDIINQRAQQLAAKLTLSKVLPLVPSATLAPILATLATGIGAIQSFLDSLPPKCPKSTATI